MEDRRVPIDPGEAQRRLAERLEEAALPPFVSAEHDTELDLLKVTSAHGVTLYMDLTRDDSVEAKSALWRCHAHVAPRRSGRRHHCRRTHHLQCPGSESLR